MSIAQSFTDTLVAPERGLAAAVGRRSWIAPLVAATVASLAAAAVVAPRLDFDRPVLERLERDAARGEPAPSAHDVDEQLAQARKVGLVAGYAQGLFGPALAAFAASVALWLAFRAAGAGKPDLRAAFSAACWGSLPLAARALLALPAASRLRGVAPEEAERVLPSSLGALLPDGVAPRLAAVAHAVDLFSLWAVVLVALGMAHATGASRRRSLLVVAVLWASYVLLARVALPGLTGGAR